MIENLVSINVREGGGKKKKKRCHRGNVFCDGKVQGWLQLIFGMVVCVQLGVRSEDHQGKEGSESEKIQI